MSSSEAPEDNIIPLEKQDLASVIGIDDNEMNERLAEAQRLSEAINSHVKTTAPAHIATGDVKWSAPAESSKKETKPQIVAKILRLQEELKIENPRPESHFNRMNKPQLEEHLAWLVNRSINLIKGTTEELKKQTEVSKQAEADLLDANEAVEHATEVKRTSKMGAKALFQFNMLVVRCAELTSVNFRKDLGTDLRGLTDDCLENRQQLEEILAEIYSENSETLSKYLSPINHYMIFMMTLGANRAFANAKRVQEEFKKSD